MAKSKGRIRFIYRRSSPLLKCVVLAAIVLSTAALILLSSATKEAEKRLEQYRQLAAQGELTNAELQQKLAELGSVKGIIRIAGEKLGLVEPDTIFFIPEE